MASFMFFWYLHEYKIYINAVQGKQNVQKFVNNCISRLIFHSSRPELTTTVSIKYNTSNGVIGTRTINFSFFHIFLKNFFPHSTEDQLTLRLHDQLISPFRFTFLATFNGRSTVMVITCSINLSLYLSPHPQSTRLEAQGTIRHQR